MLKFRVVRTRSGRTGLVFTAWSPTSNSEETFLVWYDKTDKHMCLTHAMMRVDMDTATIEIEDVGELTSIEVSLNPATVKQLPKHKITFPTMQK